jgi:putative ABC transport system permease protein
MDGLLFLLLIGVLAIALAVLGLALANRVIFKLAARNFARRKAQSAIVVAGLMIGTAIISASLVVGDTMRYIFEDGTYHALGEVDEQIYGQTQYGTRQYFGEEVYRSLSENLSGVEGIQSCAPAIVETVSMLDARTLLAEPNVAIVAFNSSIMKNTVFGDLDGKGYYTDTLGDWELAMNSLLADAMDARTGDTVRLSMGVKNATNPFTTDMVKANFTVSKIIQETDLYGKANQGQQKACFLELGRAQRLLDREGQIDFIIISNDGDTWGGEGWTGKVNGSIRKALDNAVGMKEMGFSLVRANSSLVLYSDRGYFSTAYLDILNETLIEMAKTPTGSLGVLPGTLIPLLTVNGLPAAGMFALVGPSGEGDLATINQTAAAFNMTNGSKVLVTALGLDGVPRTSEFTVAISDIPSELEGWFESHFSSLPAPFSSISIIMSGANTTKWLLSGNSSFPDMVSFVLFLGDDNATIDALAPKIVQALDDNITAEDVNLVVHDVKFDGLKSGRAAGDSIGTIFMIFSVFSIIAGVVLIVNIFVMLAEERKSEMGMARAVGMKRKHLIRMFMFEGSIYVFIASAVGALMGLAFGKLLMIAFGFVFGGAGMDFPFHFTWDSVFLAFGLGVLLTFATILVASRRAARLNIIRAIRKIPEPRGARAMRTDVLMGLALLAGGILFWLYGIAAKAVLGWMVGPSMVFLGLGLVAYKWVSIRMAMTPASLLIIFWVFKPSWLALPLENEAAASGGGLELFVASGILLVLAGVLLVMFNSDILLKGLQKTVGRTKATRAVLKTAVSYPMEGKFKTGMTLAMFSLIIFTVTVIAMIASMQASTMETEKTRQSGGFDIIGFANPGTPFVNVSNESLPPSLQKYETKQLETLAAAYIDVRHYDYKGGTSGGTGPPISVGQNINVLLGASDSFLKNNGFPLQSRDKNYSTDRQCWQALKDNDSLCIIDGGRLVSAASVYAGPQFGSSPGAYVGGTVTISDIQGQNNTRTLRIIGIMYQQYFFQGIVANKQMVKDLYGGADRYLLVQLGPGQNTDAATKDFKRAFLENGMQAIDIQAVIGLITTTVSNVMYLMEGFLAIGLLIGIAGIGIIAYRSVIERRQQIGMMRAIGYKRRNITSSFLIEISFITVIAIVMGVVFGIGIGWQIYSGGGYREMGASFAVPWGNLLVITVGAYIATLIFTFYPSLMAARVPPAEALRYIE